MNASKQGRINAASVPVQQLPDKTWMTDNSTTISKDNPDLSTLQQKLVLPPGGHTQGNEKQLIFSTFRNCDYDYLRGNDRDTDFVDNTVEVEGLILISSAD